MLKATTNLIKDLKKQKRENSSLLFLDNIKIIKDVIKNGFKPLCILTDDEGLSFDCDNIFKVERKTIEMLADTKTPQGVVCVLEYPQYVVEKPKTNFLVLDRLQDPGNVGSLIRTATACGFEYIYLIDSVKVGNSKLVRSSVGTVFYSKIFSLTSDEFIKKAKEWQLTLVKADMNGENIFEAEFDGMVGLVVGNEGQGVSQQISEICKANVKIPMKECVESLNAAISGSIIMYEIAKKTLK